MKVRRKVEELEATQWFMDGDHPNVKEQTTHTQVWVKGQFYTQYKGENYRLVVPGDWIVDLPNGRSQVLSPTEFNKEYVAI